MIAYFFYKSGICGEKLGRRDKIVVRPTDWHKEKGAKVRGHLGVEANEKQYAEKKTIFE